MKIYRVHKGPSSTEEIKVGSKTLLAIDTLLFDHGTAEL